MSALGEWDESAPVDSPAPPPAAVAVTKDIIDAIIAAEVRQQVRKTIQPIVAEAIATILTPARLAELRDLARQATETELSPPARAELPPAAEPPPLYYGSVEEFVREMIVPVFCRAVGERAARRWQAAWWQSTEAIIRLEALWRAWEHLRLDPGTGMSIWLRDHADHHLTVLMDPDGPWAKSNDSARPGEPLPYEAPPEGLFVDVRIPKPADLGPGKLIVT